MISLFDRLAPLAMKSLACLGLSASTKHLAGFWDYLQTKGSDGHEIVRILQPIWNLRLGFEEYVASPLFPIVVSVTVYFLCMLPWTLLDLFAKDWKWLQRHKLQPTKEVTWPSVRKAVGLTLWNHLLYLLPVSMAQWVWTPNTELPEAAPELWDFCWQQYAALMIFDLEYFVWHFCHHKVKFLYKHVHGVHHEYHATHVWVTQYLHPWELISVGIFTTTSPWFFNAHPMTQLSFQLLSILVSVEDHLGYDFSILPAHWIPLYGGGLKHDMHHQKPLSNYQPFFNWWDRLFGTECPGQMAGGYKPPGLLEWERREQEAMIKRLAKKQQMQQHEGSAGAGKD